MKRSNEYAQAFGRLYAETPKAVFAAIAFSLCFIDVEEAGTNKAIGRFREEWRCLYQNGIVPQNPPTEKDGNVYDV
jgi:hypothetical protein